MRTIKNLTKKVTDKIDKYLHCLNVGEHFTVQDVCEVTNCDNEEKLDNYLCGLGFRTSMIERNGDLFIRRYSLDSKLYNMVMTNMKRHGIIELDDFVGMPKLERQKIDEILDKGCTEYGWVKKDKEGSIVYYR